jgi:NAD(P)-dependent dehydrogenase (short-subunit alcohol dehydrogenase family)
LLDVTQPESSEQLASFLGKKFGRLDVLVNNADVWLDNLDSSDGSVLKTKIATLSKTIE